MLSAQRFFAARFVWRSGNQIRLLVNFTIAIAEGPNAGRQSRAMEKNIGFCMTDFLFGSGGARRGSNSYARKHDRCTYNDRINPREPITCLPTRARATTSPLLQLTSKLSKLLKVHR